MTFRVSSVNICECSRNIHMLLQVDSYGVARDTGYLLSCVGCWQLLRMLQLPGKDKLRYLRIGNKIRTQPYVLEYIEWHTLYCHVVITTFSRLTLPFCAAVVLVEIRNDNQLKIIVSNVIKDRQINTYVTHIISEGVWINAYYIWDVLLSNVHRMQINPARCDTEIML